jgi:hypothetical protein
MGLRAVTAVIRCQPVETLLAEFGFRGRDRPGEMDATEGRLPESVDGLEDVEVVRSGGPSAVVVSSKSDEIENIDEDEDYSPPLWGEGTRPEQKKSVYVNTIFYLLVKRPGDGTA